jgi:hypothetical protein
MNDDTPDALRPAGAPRRPSLPNFVSFVMAVALVWLGGQFIRQGVSDNALGHNPETAVLWWGDSSDAIAQLARVRLQTRDASGAARLAVKAIQLSPLNASALTTYGLAMDAQRPSAIANRAMTLAGQRSWRDLVTQVWLFRRDVLASDFSDAFDHADALLRRVPEPPPAVLGILAVAARNPAAIGPLTDRLAANPNWRQPFFIYLVGYAKPPATGVAGQLLTRLAAGPSPPTDEEVGFYLASLASQGKYQEAEAAWRALTPGAGHDGYVHDANFERPARTTPFDWWLVSGVGWLVGIADSPDPAHGHALRIDYDGVSHPQPVRQLIVLPPGSYRFSGRMLDAGDGGDSGFVWRVACVGATDPLAKAPPPAGPAGQWRTFSADFTVPASACPAQLLDLAADRGEVPSNITLWYDDLAIVPAPAVAPKPQAPAAGDSGIPAKL